MTGAVQQTLAQPFLPSAFESFRFTARALDEHGRVTLGYALDEQVEFREELLLPLAAPLAPELMERVDGLLALLHWTAGVSYFKTALPPRVELETGAPPPAAARALEALYSEGLGELAYVNGLSALPRPRFGADAPGGPGRASGALARESSRHEPRRLLVPVGGGKDSAVAIEIARRSGLETALFSIGDAPPIARTAAVAGLARLLARRRIDPGLAALNRRGAINGHVPITAIVSCAAMLTAALNGFDAVAMANERSASHGNVRFDGVEVNHQFSKSLAAERLLAAAFAEAAPGMGYFSILRPASELAIARAFARLDRYHPAFTSCNAIFRLDPELRASSWCRDCPKCRFVFLALAPFSDPAHLREVFGADLLAEESQFEGFALLTATGGHKPFECVGEERESLAAIRMLAEDERWRDHTVVRKLSREVLALSPAGESDVADVLALGGEHLVPESLMGAVGALLGA